VTHKTAITYFVIKFCLKLNWFSILYKSNYYIILKQITNKEIKNHFKDVQIKDLNYATTGETNTRTSQLLSWQPNTYRSRHAWLSSRRKVPEVACVVRPHTLQVLMLVKLPFLKSWKLTINLMQQQCIVPQIFNLRPHLLKSIVHVIRFITNRKYTFYCLY